MTTSCWSSARARAYGTDLPERTKPSYSSRTSGAVDKDEDNNKDESDVVLVEHQGPSVWATRRSGEGLPWRAISFMAEVKECSMAEESSYMEYY